MTTIEEAVENIAHRRVFISGTLQGQRGDRMDRYVRNGMPDDVEYFVASTGRNVLAYLDAQGQWHWTHLPQGAVPATTLRRHREAVERAVKQTGATIADAPPPPVVPPDEMAGRMLGSYRYSTDALSLIPQVVAALDSSEVEPLREQLAQITQERDAFLALVSEAANKVADREGWCPSFEKNVRPLGLTGREGTQG